MMPALVQCMFELYELGLIPSTIIREISIKIKMSVLELMLEVIFYPDQTEEIVKRLHSLKEEMMKMETTEELASPDFIHKMLKKLNSILPNAAIPNKKVRPVPTLFMPLVLVIIIRMQRELGKPKPWEEFMEIVRLLIKSNKHREPDVWGGLVRFAKLDKDLLGMKLSSLLSSEDYEDLYNEAN